MLNICQKKTLSTFLFCSLLAPMAAAAPKAATKVVKPKPSEQLVELGTLLVGVIRPVSGPQAAYGEDVDLGIQLALEKLRVTQPDLVQHIQVLKEDGQSTPEGAKKAAESLIRQHATVLIGSITNSSSAAVAQIAQEYGVPLVAPASSALSSGGDSPFVFLSCQSDKTQGLTLANFSRTVLRKDRAALLLDPNVSFSSELFEQFKKAFTLQGGTIVLVENYESGNPQFAQHLQNIAMAKPDFILFPSGISQDAATVMEELKKAKVTIPLLGTDRWHLPKLQQYPGHFYPLAFTLEDPTGTTTEFVTAFTSRTKRYPSALAAMSYDAMLVVADAFHRAHTIRMHDFMRALARTRELPGLLGPISFNSEQSAEKSSFIMETSGQGSQVRALVPAR